MNIQQLYSNFQVFLFEPVDPQSQKNGKVTFWFVLTLIIITLYTLISFEKVWRGEYSAEITEDDIRGYSLWMHRLVKPDLFPNDLMADYWQVITPPGYKLFFRLMVILGIPPLFLFQILPILLIIIGSIYVFFTCFELLSVPVAGFVGSILFWIAFFPIGATPRGFAVMFFPAFIYYLLRGSLLPCLLALFLVGSFYTPCMFVAVGVLILRLFKWEGGYPYLSRKKNDYIFCFAGLGIAALAILPYILYSSKYNPTFTRAEAIMMPEFWEGGRAPFFHKKFVDNYIFGWMSGIRPRVLFSPFLLTWPSLILPLLIAFPVQFPLSAKLKQNSSILWQIVVSSFIMFVIAHLVFIKLYYPNRYTIISLGLVIIFAASLSIIILFDTLIRWSNKLSFPWSRWGNVVITGMILAFGIYLLFYSASLIPDKAPRAQLHVPSIEAFFSRQPQNIVVASLDDIIADNIPTFSQRSVLTGQEFAFPLHPKFYNIIKRRTLDLIDAHYDKNLENLKQFIKNYGVDYFVIRNDAFTPQFINNSIWFTQWKDLRQKVLSQIDRGEIPALIKLANKCSSFKTDTRVVISADCILNSN